MAERSPSPPSMSLAHPLSTSAMLLVAAHCCPWDTARSPHPLIHSSRTCHCLAFFPPLMLLPNRSSAGPRLTSTAATSPVTVPLA